MSTLAPTPLPHHRLQLPSHRHLSQLGFVAGVGGGTLAYVVRASVAAAEAVVGPEVTASALPRLHPWALSGATRTALKGRPGHPARRGRVRRIYRGVLASVGP